MEFVPVVNAGDPGQIGAPGVVPYSFEIGKFEVTNAQYAEFLNAVAKADPNALYNPFMGSAPEGGITRSGADGAFQYAVKAGRGNHPVNFVSIFDAWRFVNWLTNGQPTGNQGDGVTETGVYLLHGDSSLGNFGADFSVWRAGGYAMPNAYEWVKAAYFDRESGTLFDYPGSDTPPVAEAPPGGSNSANYLNAVGDLTPVGAFTRSTGPYGAFDQAGNVEEWTDAISVSQNTASLRGGTFLGTAQDFLQGNYRNDNPANEGPGTGFRIVRKMWGPYSFASGGYVQTGDFLGVVWVTLEPWVWSRKLGKWLYTNAQDVADGGAWVFIPKD